jgi:hypothetical protein
MLNDRPILHYKPKYFQNINYGTWELLETFFIKNIKVVYGL